MPNISDDYADRITSHSIDLLRVAAGHRDDVLKMLSELESSLVAKLSNAAGKTAFTQARLNALLKQTQETIARAYKSMADHNASSLGEIAQHEANYTVNTLNGLIGADLMAVSMSPQQFQKLADKTLVFGAPAKEWWGRQETLLAGNFASQMRMGFMNGETVDKLVQRVRGTRANGYTDGLMIASRRQAEALVRTSVISIANEARIQTYKDNRDVCKGIQWVSTLDSRTTAICRALDGLQWDLDYKPIGHDKAFPGSTAHWNCRSTQISVLKSWKELAEQSNLEGAIREKAIAAGETADQIDRRIERTRASMDGQVAANLNFNDWLKGKSTDFQDSLLGPGRATLFRAGNASMVDMTNQFNRPLTIEQMKAKASNEVVSDMSIPQSKGGINYSDARGEADVAQATKYLFDMALDKDQLLNLFGTPDNAILHLTPIKIGPKKSPQWNLYAAIAGPNITGAATISVTQKGEIAVGSLFLDNQQSQKHGGSMLALGRMISVAKNIGVKSIVTSASALEGDTGYFTWPKLGFDADIPNSVLEKGGTPPHSEKRVSELYNTPEGKKWWKENGRAEGLIDMTFDTMPGSRALQTFTAIYNRLNR